MQAAPAVILGCPCGMDQTRAPLPTPQPPNPQHTHTRFTRTHASAHTLTPNLATCPPTLTPGDDEEIERFWKELGLTEKGKVLVKGILG